jgi:hypothetical protein
VRDQASRITLVIGFQTAQLKAKATKLLSHNARTAERTEKVLKIIDEAKKLLDAINGWFQQLKSTGWENTIIATIPEYPESDIANNEVFPGPVFGFPGLWAATKSCNARATRILLCDIIIRCNRWICDPADDTSTKEYSESRRQTREDLANLISSIPYFFSWGGDAMMVTLCGNSSDPKAFAGASCMWSLLVAGLCDFATPNQRAYVRGRLAAISQGMGIRQANIFARVSVFPG